MTSSCESVTGIKLLNKSVISDNDGWQLLRKLIHDVQWHQDHFFAFDRRFDIPRLQAWFADDGIQYAYSNNLLHTQGWTPELAVLQRRVEQLTGFPFNAVLATYYRDGQDCVDWHADDEAELGPEPIIASLSLGATRKFYYRHQTQAITKSCTLRHTDLLLMQPIFQHCWQHSVPPESHITQPRINLTFRNVVNR